MVVEKYENVNIKRLKLKLEYKIKALKILQKIKNTKKCSSYWDIVKQRCINIIN